jgi:hypothetical protein
VNLLEIFGTARSLKMKSGTKRSEENMSWLENGDHTYVCHPIKSVEEQLL